MKSRIDASDRAPAAPTVSAVLGLLRDERGATAIEYSVAAGIAMAVAGAIRLLGTNVLTNLYDQIAAAFS